MFAKWGCCCLLACAAFVACAPPKVVSAHLANQDRNPSHIWVTAYYVGWEESIMPVSAIDFRPITHLAFFSLTPTKGGGLDGTEHGVTDDSASQVEKAVHAAARKALICIGGEGSGPAYEDAISDDNRATFIKNICDWIAKHHYDGVDIDMEPVQDKDIPNFQSFIRGLHEAMNARGQKWLLTAAAGDDQLKAYVDIQSLFDQINLMTYDMSGPWEGWETWYNGPIYNGGRKFKSSGEPLHCIDLDVKAWLAAGIPAKKLGIGIAFYGAAWHGATGPNQSIKDVTMTTLSYADIMDKLYSPDRYHWDKGPEAPYLSVNGATPKENEFVSYDDEKLCADKIAYVRSKGLGGAIIWELEQGYRPSQQEKNPLLTAISNALK